MLIVLFIAVLITIGLVILVVDKIDTLKLKCKIRNIVNSPEPCTNKYIKEINNKLEEHNFGRDYPLVINISPQLWKKLNKIISQNGGKLFNIPVNIDGISQGISVEKKSDYFFKTVLKKDCSLLEKMEAIAKGLDYVVPKQTISRIVINRIDDVLIDVSEVLYEVEIYVK